MSRFMRFLYWSRDTDLSFPEERSWQNVAAKSKNPTLSTCPGDAVYWNTNQCSVSFHHWLWNRVFNTGLEDISPNILHSQKCRYIYYPEPTLPCCNLLLCHSKLTDSSIIPNLPFQAHHSQDEGKGQFVAQKPLRALLFIILHSCNKSYLPASPHP